MSFSETYIDTSQSEVDVQTPDGNATDNTNRNTDISGNTNLVDGNTVINNAIVVLSFYK